MMLSSIYPLAGQLAWTGILSPNRHRRQSEKNQSSTTRVIYIMKKQDSKIRSCTLTGLLLAFCLAVPSYAAQPEPELKAYTATYDVKGRGISLGTAEISLQPYENMWRWRMTTQANAFVSLFTDDKPISETMFTWSTDGLRLQKIHIGDENDDKDVETASFDWDDGQIDVFRKNQESQVPLAAEVYDLQSVHLRAAIMQANQEDEASFQFYLKGKLVESKLVHVGNDSLQIGDRKIEASIYEHSISDSDKSLKYYYEAARPTLPLLIENEESGKSQSELRLQKVDWQS